MRLGTLPSVIPIYSKRELLSSNGLIVENLKVGDVVVVSNPDIGSGKITVKDIELGKIGFTFSGLNPRVTVYDIKNQVLMEGKAKVQRRGSNFFDGLFRLEQLSPEVTQNLLSPRSLGIVPRNGKASELKLFLDYACPSNSNLGTVCNLGFVGSNFNFTGSEVITKENKDHAEVVLSLST